MSDSLTVALSSARSLVLRVDQQLRKQRAATIEQRQSGAHTDRLANRAGDTGFPDELE